MIRLNGLAAIEYAEKNGLLINKYQDPIEGECVDITPEKGREIIKEDPSLVYVLVEEEEN